MYNTNENMIELSILLQKIAIKYTMKESSSISIEKAQQLMFSIIYSINIFLEEQNKNLSLVTNKTDAEFLYNNGLKVIRKKVNKAKDIYDKIKQNIYEVDNFSYNETIYDGINNFFINYDICYASHETPGMIDYQLFIPVEKLTGIKYILSYIKKLYIENEFCRNYDLEKVDILLKSYSKDYSVLLINIFEFVLTNSIANVILEKDFKQLDITISDKNKLYLIFRNLSVFEIEKLCLSSLNIILKEFNIKNKETIDYLIKSVSIIAQNIKNKIEINFGSLFITFKFDDNINILKYTDGENMNDINLCEFINIMNNCKSIDEKLVLINEKVRSLQDLIEVLDNCIWEDEYEKVYNILEDNELNYLMIDINNLLLEGLEIKELKEWQQQLIVYLSDIC